MTQSHPDSAYLAALDDIATGELQDVACKRAGVTRKGLWEWSQRTPENRSAYAHARLSSATALEEEILERARSLTPETYAAENVAIQTLKWAAAKRHPKEYGDKVVNEHNVTVASLHLDALRAPRITAQLATPQRISAGDDVEATA